MRILLFLIGLTVVAAPTHKDIEYAVVDGHSLKLDIYLPEAKNPLLVLWIHGGGWRKGSKERCHVSWLAEHGFAVASINYRLTNKAKFPAQIHDCKGALRWLRANSAKYGYRADRVVVGGSSAGGHLAALLGVTHGIAELEGTVGGNLDQSSKVTAIVNFFGPMDFRLRSRTQPERANAAGGPVALLLGGGADKLTEAAKLASPAFHVTADDPPMLAFHGGKDKTVLLDQAHRIDEVYRKAGLSIDLQILKGAGHGGNVFYKGASREYLLEFLRTQLR